MIKKLFSLEGKVAVVTGGSRGIGRAIAMGFAEYGAHVIVASRKMEDLVRVVDEIKAAGGKADPLQLHIGRPEQIEEFFKMVATQFGGADILVNNAATNPHFGPMHTADADIFDKTMQTNLRGYFLTSKYAAEQMEKKKGGSIINLGSIGGLKSGPMLGVYGVSKAAVFQMTRQMAKELGPLGIRVNAIAPGLIKTDFSRALWESEEILEIAQSGQSLQVMGMPEDIAGTALLLASDAGRFITGTTAVVDGGAMA
jgi:NAD(P)-dependent dehydrogenase (short-subunit alcohol dehydrogenase family)